MKNKKGFTLVELLAVIVILAIILVIAVPQILNTINSARLGAFRSTAKLLISQAEKQYLVDTTLLGSAAKHTYTGSECNTLAKLDDNYNVSECSIEILTEDEASPGTHKAGSAKLVSLSGADDKKFDGYSCTNVFADTVDTNACQG